MNMVRYNDIQDEMIKGMVRGFIKATANHDASVILNQYEGFKTKGWKEVVVNCPMLTHKVAVPAELFKTIADKMLGVFEGEDYYGAFGQLFKQMDATSEEIQSKMNETGRIVVGAFSEDNVLLGKLPVPLLHEEVNFNPLQIATVIAKKYQVWVLAMVARNGGNEFNFQILDEENIKVDELADKLCFWDQVCAR